MEHKSFTCDYHDAELHAGSFTSEEEAYEQGWATFARSQYRETVVPAIPPYFKEMRLSARWHTDHRHVCSSCMLDPECQAWLEGWQPQTMWDRENYDKARAAA